MATRTANSTRRLRIAGGEWASAKRRRIRAQQSAERASAPAPMATASPARKIASSRTSVGTWTVRKERCRMRLSVLLCLPHIERPRGPVCFDDIAELGAVGQLHLVAAANLHFLRRVSIAIDDGARGLAGLLVDARSRRVRRTRGRQPRSARRRGLPPASRPDGSIPTSAALSSRRCQSSRYASRQRDHCSGVRSDASAGTSARSRSRRAATRCSRSFSASDGFRLLSEPAWERRRRRRSSPCAAFPASRAAVASRCSRRRCIPRPPPAPPG